MASPLKQVPHSERLADSASLTLYREFPTSKCCRRKLNWTELTDQWPNENWADPSLTKNSSDQSNQGSGVFCCVTSRSPLNFPSLLHFLSLRCCSRPILSFPNLLSFPPFPVGLFQLFFRSAHRVWTSKHLVLPNSMSHRCPTINKSAIMAMQTSSDI